jgi:hypothetical protein
MTHEKITPLRERMIEDMRIQPSSYEEPRSAWRSRPTEQT